MVAQSWINPQDWMRTNCVGQVKLLEALKDLNSLKRVYTFSTPEVYGNTSDWIIESHPFNHQHHMLHQEHLGYKY